ncbi:DUF2953 domain-containing protein [Allobacillus sp. GCM10007491]|uniref:DUF2953 domain-containing protein n=1 Tax=Allobacillus saliphilus TaxID=2912308 RepID=A0A941CV54_9BACI|nr:DUF2953 domain-containing protein [Allobacillus saliphilus]MBR7553784.1 DUF2953 domain-containing protein [Allobacillus saliphilus]
MGIWIGFGILTLVIFLIVLWVLHRHIEISLRLVYSKDEKVANINVTWLFISYEKTIILPQNEQLLDQLVMRLNEKHKKQTLNNYRKAYQQLMEIAASLEMNEFKWRTVYGLRNANETATLYGIGYAVKHAFFHHMNRIVKSSAKPEIIIEPNFQQPEFETNFSCIFFAPLGHIIGNLRKLKSIVNEVDKYE